MKKDIHPDYHMITIEMTDGTSYQSRSTWGKEGQTMKLEIDPITHPAWHEGTRMGVLEKGQLNKFNKRFGGLSASSAVGKKAPAKKDESAA